MLLSYYKNLALIIFKFSYLLLFSLLKTYDEEKNVGIELISEMNLEINLIKVCFPLSLKIIVDIPTVCASHCLIASYSQLYT